MIKNSLRLFRKFSSDIYSPESLEKIKKMGADYEDGRIFDSFSMKELKKRVSPEQWAQITANDPLFKIPELQDLWDIEDLKPHYHEHLPPHLQKPAIMLNERQREAKRLTLEWIKGERALEKERKSKLGSFPILSTDECEIHCGLMLVRDPIWLMGADKDVEWAKIRFRTMRKHGVIAKMDDTFEYLEEKKTLEDERSIRISELEQKLDNGEPLVYSPIQNSKHWLEADPNEENPRSIGYAGGYRVWLMLREKETQKWVFPNLAIVGASNFEETRLKVMTEVLGDQIHAYHLGPRPFMVDTKHFSTPIHKERPRYFEEDIFDLYLKRLKILMPRSTEEDLVKLLSKKYLVDKIKEPVIRQIKGIKTFYFRSLHYTGDFQLKNTDVYDDWAWVPKIKLNKYLEKPEFEKFVQVMSS